MSDPSSFILMHLNPNQRIDIEIGQRVRIIQKHHQMSGFTTEGVIKRILTKSPVHPHGIKVQLENGEVGRVKEIIS